MRVLFGTEFEAADVATTGKVRSFTIVAFGPPGVEVPYVAALVDCAGTTVRANLVDVPADPGHVQLDMQVALTTYSLGTDSAGDEAIGFGFAPATQQTTHGTT